MYIYIYTNKEALTWSDARVRDGEDEQHQRDQDDGHHLLSEETLARKRQQEG